MGLVSFRTDSGTGFLQDKQWDWFHSGQIVGLVSFKTVGPVSLRTDSGTGFIQDTVGLVSIRTDSGTGFIQDKQWDWFYSGQTMELVSFRTVGLVSFRTDNGTGFIQDR